LPVTSHWGRNGVEKTEQGVPKRGDWEDSDLRLAPIARGPGFFIDFGPGFLHQSPTKGKSGGGGDHEKNGNRKKESVKSVMAQLHAQASSHDRG